MSRATRVEFPGATYHVMARTVEGIGAFPVDSDKATFLSKIGEIVEGGDLEVHAFCLMWNHFHLLAGTPRGELSRWMQRILGTYAQRFNFLRKRSGHLWQGRYKAILVEKGPYLIECSRYIHLNPTHKGKRLAERWKWSSYRNYVGGAGKPIAHWVNTSTVLGELGVGSLPGKKAAAEYRKYVEEGKGQEEISPFERATVNLVLGSESFIDWIKKGLQERQLNEDEPSLKQLRRHGLLPAQVIEEIAKGEFGDIDKRSMARRVLMYCLLNTSGLRPTGIARRLGVTRGAVTKAVAAVTERIQEDEAFRRKLNRVTRRLKAQIKNR